MRDVCLLPLQQVSALAAAHIVDLERRPVAFTLSRLSQVLVCASENEKSCISSGDQETKKPVLTYQHAFYPVVEIPHVNDTALSSFGQSLLLQRVVVLSHERRVTRRLLFIRSPTTAHGEVGRSAELKFCEKKYNNK